MPSFHSHEKHVDIRKPIFLDPTQVLSRLRRQPWFIGGQVSVLLRRSALAEVWESRSELGPMGDGFVVHFAALKYGMCYIPEPLVAFRITSNNLGSSTARQPELMMDILAHKLRLMQEPKYRKIFPESFIDLKRKEFTYVSFMGSLVGRQSDLIQELRNLVPPQTFLGRGAIRLLRGLMRLQQLVLKKYCYKNIALPLRKK